MGWVEGMGRFSGMARVEGDCMMPRIPAGSWVWYDAAKVPDVGDVVVALDGEKRLVKEIGEWDGQRWLVAKRGRAPRLLEPPLRVLGVVAMVMHPP